MFGKRSDPQRTAQERARAAAERAARRAGRPLPPEAFEETLRPPDVAPHEPLAPREALEPLEAVTREPSRPEEREPVDDTRAPRPPRGANAPRPAPRADSVADEGRYDSQRTVEYSPFETEEHAVAEPELGPEPRSGRELGSAGEAPARRGANPRRPANPAAVTSPAADSPRPPDPPPAAVAARRVDRADSAAGVARPADSVAGVARRVDRVDSAAAAVRPVDQADSAAGAALGADVAPPADRAAADSPRVDTPSEPAAPRLVAARTRPDAAVPPETGEHTIVDAEPATAPRRAPAPPLGDPSKARRRRPAPPRRQRLGGGGGASLGSRLGGGAGASHGSRVGGGGALSGPRAGGGGRRWGRRIGVLLALIAIIVALYVINGVFQPFHGDGSGTVSVVIPQGTKAEGIADLLAQRKVIDSSRFFLLAASVRGQRGKLRPGHYTLRRGMTNAAAIDALTALPAAPKPIASKTLTLIEGPSRKENAPVVDKSGKVKGAYARASASATTLRRIRRLGAPKGTKTAEGFLFPATYTLPAGSTAQDLVNQQLAAFAENFQHVDMGYAKRRHLSRYDVLIIASMIEREAQLAKERSLVSAVIYNRLAQDMPLGIDATIRYYTDNWKRPIRQSELDAHEPYNSRINRGLPPTPIGNPGLASIKAAAAPAKKDYLFYVRKPGKSGEHAFSSTDAQFEKDVQRYEASRGK